MVDASTVVELVLATDTGAAVARRLRGEVVHAPAHLDVEAVGAIRRAVTRRLISDHEGLVAVGSFRNLNIRSWPTRAFVERAYQLRATHTVADGLYIALAEGLAAPLLACDGPLKRSPGHTARIELID